jgi:hypothetical protein
MNALPHEITARICRFASTDGGSTAGMLRLVSRGMCEIANLHRFYTVSVSGVDAVEQLVQALGNCSPELRAVTHLFLSDKPRSSATDKFSRPPGETADRLKNLVRAQIQRTNEQEARHIAPLLHQLISYVASSLGSFTLLLFNPCHHEPFVVFRGIKLPLLSSLTIRYPAWMNGGPWPSVHMPSLRFLALEVGAPLTTCRDLVEHLLDHQAPVDFVTVRGIAPTVHLLRFVSQLADEREQLNASTRALVNYDFYPVNPDPLSRLDQHRQAHLKRFMQDAERIAIEGARIRSMTDKAPSYKDWLELWTCLLIEKTI